MKRIVYLLMVWLGFVYQPAYSQFGLYVHGIGTKSSWQETKFKYGVGAAAKIHLGKVSLGAASKYIPLPVLEFQSSSFQQKSTVTPLTGLVEYAFTKGIFKPYLGVEAGKYRIRSRITSVSETTVSYAVSRWGVAPKLGFSLAIIGLGLFAEGSYHRILGSEQETILSAPGTIWKNPNAFWTLQAGLRFGLL